MNSNTFIQKKVNVVFSILIALILIAMIIVFGFVTLYYKEANATPITNLGVRLTTTLFSDTVFTLLGFGLILSAFKNAKWSGMAIALLVVSFNIVVGVLLQDMWFEIFFGFRKNIVDGNNGQVAAANAVQFWNRHSVIGRTTPSALSFRMSNLCSTAYLVGMTAFVGRVTLTSVILSLPFFNFLFYLNYYLNLLLTYSNTNKASSMEFTDAYGTILIYLFGGVFGLIVGVLTKTSKQTGVDGLPQERKSRVSITLGLLGAFFLFATYINSFTSINVPSLLNAPFNSQIILSIFAQCTGVLGTFVGAYLVGKGRMNIECIIMGTITGGIIMGAIADKIGSIGAVMFLGFIAGIIAGIFLSVLTPKMNQENNVDSLGLVGPILVVSVIGCLIINPSVVSQLFIRGATTDWRAARFYLGLFAVTTGISAFTGLLIGFLKNKLRFDGKLDYDDVRFFAEDYGLYSYVAKSRIGGVLPTSQTQQNLNPGVL